MYVGLEAPDPRMVETSLMSARVLYTDLLLMGKAFLHTARGTVHVHVCVLVWCSDLLSQSYSLTPLGYMYMYMYTCTMYIISSSGGQDSWALDGNLSRSKAPTGGRIDDLLRSGSFCSWISPKYIGLLLLNPFASGIQKVLLSHITGLFSVKIRKKFLAIKNFSVNDTMSAQPNKRLIHWHFEN